MSLSVDIEEKKVGAFHLLCAFRGRKNETMALLGVRLRQV